MGAKVTLATWQAWLKAIEQDIYVLHSDRARWRELLEIAKANPNIPNPGFVLDWIARLYISHVTSGIRRQMDLRRDVVSLRRLLDSIARNPNLITRDQFVRAWCGDDPDDSFEVCSAMAGFDDYASPVGSGIDPTIVREDIGRLLATGGKIKTFVNERIAHLDIAHADVEEFAKLVAPTFNELDAALSLLGALLQKYYLLLTGKSLATAEPTLQYNWTLPLTVAWIPPEPD